MGASTDPVPDRRRQHFVTAAKARLDDQTRAIGRQGLARARAELARHGKPALPRRPGGSGLVDPNLRPRPRARVRPAGAPDPAIESEPRAEAR